MNLKIKKYREQKRISQRRLADMIGKSFRTVQQWESGETFPNAEAIWDLCEVFDTDPNDLLGWWDEHARPEAPDLTPEEAELLECFRDSAPQWRTNIAMTARAALGESKKEAPPLVRQEPVREAV